MIVCILLYVVYLDAFVVFRLLLYLPMFEYCLFHYMLVVYHYHELLRHLCVAEVYINRNFDMFCSNRRTEQDLSLHQY